MAKIGYINCAMEPFGFEKLPEIIRKQFEKVEHIEELVSHINPASDDSNDLLTVREAADYLKISVQSLYCKVSRMEIPVSKPGRRLYFSQSELKKWITDSRRKTAAELFQESQKKIGRLDKKDIFI